MAGTADQGAAGGVGNAVHRRHDRREGAPMGRVEGKVAFVTGAARDQGRTHAVRLAQEGANIIAIDRCEDLDTVIYPMATDDDLAQHGVKSVVYLCCV